MCQSGYVPENLIHVFEYEPPGAYTCVDQIIYPDSMDSKYRTTFIHCDTSVFPKGLVIVTYADIHYIAALSLMDKQLVWRVQGKVGGKLCDPRDVTSDQQGRVYVADGLNGRIIILRAMDGSVLQAVDLGHYGIVMIAWKQRRNVRESPSLMLYCLPKKEAGWHVSAFHIDRRK